MIPPLATITLHLLHINSLFPVVFEPRSIACAEDEIGVVIVLLAHHRPYLLRLHVTEGLEFILVLRNQVAHQRIVLLIQ